MLGSTCASEADTLGSGPAEMRGVKQGPKHQKPRSVRIHTPSYNDTFMLSVCQDYSYFTWVFCAPGISPRGPSKLPIWLLLCGYFAKKTGPPLTQYEERTWLHQGGGAAIVLAARRHLPGSVGPLPRGPGPMIGQSSHVARRLGRLSPAPGDVFLPAQPCRL